MSDAPIVFNGGPTYEVPSASLTDLVVDEEPAGDDEWIDATEWVIQLDQ